MQIKQQFVIREVAGDYLLIPSGKSALDLNGMITTNEVGATIWKELPNVESEEALVARIMAEYEADEAQVRADVHEFLKQLRRMEIV